MKKTLLHFLFCMCLLHLSAQPPSYQTNWTTNPYDQQVFIENRGQCNHYISTSDKILYQANLGNIKAFFTPNGIIYRYDKYKKKEQEIEKEEEESEAKSERERERGRKREIERESSEKPNTYYLDAFWQGANTTAKVEALEEQSYYYSYGMGDKPTIQTKAFKKIIYHDMYPGIDVEYFFLDGKDGIKYDVIVHPGADLSLYKLKYIGAKGIKVDAKGNALIESKVGNFTEHTPVCYYRENKENISVSYKIHGGEESFVPQQNYDSNKTLVIDPWTTNPNFTTRNRAYDVNYDSQGNVFAYGGINTGFELVKLNSAGVIQWKCNPNNNNPYGSSAYGDFAVDRVTGDCFVVEGMPNGWTFQLASVWKINTSGTVTATFVGSGASQQYSPSFTKIGEMWRCAFNQCTNQLVIGGGGVWSSYQAMLLDPNMTTFTPVNILGAPYQYHDVAAMALDKTGANCFFAFSKDITSFSNTKYDNMLMGAPMPALSPSLFQVNEGYNFQEQSNMRYVPAVLATFGIGAGGFNGMTISRKFLYMYDGSTVKRFDKSSGALLKTVVAGGIPFMWGGLDVDDCDDLYAGFQNSIFVYDPSLVKTSTITMTDTVYDLILEKNYQTLYACGKGFVSSVNITTINPPPTTIMAQTGSTGCTCVGTAKATLIRCGVPDTSTTLKYLWNNGKTTRSLSGLCPGKYSVTISDGTGVCIETYKDTITVPGTLSNVSFTSTLSNVKCFGDKTGTASANPAGGTSPYTYSWSNGQTTSSVSLLPAGNYTVKLTDAAGCTHDSAIVITQPPPITHSKITTPATCGASDGTATVTVNGGTSPYTYSWNTGSVTSSLSTIPKGLYTLTTLDANGCKDTTLVKVAGSNAFNANSNFGNVSCYGGTNGTATVNVTLGTPPYTYSWNNGQTTSSISGLVAGTYTCVIYDKSAICGDTLIVTLSQPAQLKVQAQGSPATCFGACNGQANIIPAGGTAPYTYSWSNGSAVAGQSSLCLGTYVITLTDKNNCTHDTTIIITEPSALTFSKNTTPTTCGASNGTASVTAGGGTPSYSYSWNNNSQSAGLTGIASGTYTLTVTDANGCTDTVQMNVPSTAPFALNSAPASVKCNGDKTASLTVNVSGTSSPYLYSWDNGQTTTSISNLAAGTYTLTVTDVNNCTGVIVETVIQPAPLALPSDKKIICEGQSSTINANVTGGSGPYTYLWNTGSTSSSLTDAPSSTTNYTVVTTDANGCTLAQTDTIKVNPVPVAVFGGPNVCVGIKTTFKDSSHIKNGAISSWTWDFGDGSHSTIQNPGHTYSVPGTYTVTLTVADGPCPATMTHTITVYPTPTADFSANPQPTSVMFPTITFTDLSVGGIKGKWYFGDLSDTTYAPAKNPVHTYPNDNVHGGETYNVKLYIINQFGCPDSIVKPIHIDPEWAFYIPNAMSPNGDGLNDVFFGTGFGIVEKEMWIFDRWGLQIFHTTDLNGTWDGKVQGGESNELVQQDVYVWVIKIKEVFGYWHKYIGHVTVVR